MKTRPILLTEFSRFAVSARRPRPVGWPSWTSGAYDIAEAHCLARIVSEGNARLRVYGWRSLGNSWQAIG